MKLKSFLKFFNFDYCYNIQILDYKAIYFYCTKILQFTVQSLIYFNTASGIYILNYLLQNLLSSIGTYHYPSVSFLIKKLMVICNLWQKIKGKYKESNLNISL